MPEVTIEDQIKSVQDLVQTQRKVGYEPEMTVSILKTLKKTKEREDKINNYIKTKIGLSDNLNARDHLFFLSGFETAIKWIKE